MFCSNSGLSGDHYARLPSNNLSQTAFELWKLKESGGRQQLSGAPHATHARSVDKPMCVENWTVLPPTLARINTDYDPGSVVSTAQFRVVVVLGQLSLASLQGCLIEYQLRLR